MKTARSVQWRINISPRYGAKPPGPMLGDPQLDAKPKRVKKLLKATTSRLTAYWRRD